MEPWSPVQNWWPLKWLSVKIIVASIENSKCAIPGRVYHSYTPWSLSGAVPKTLVRISFFNGCGLWKVVVKEFPSRRGRRTVDANWFIFIGVGQ